MPEFMLFVRNQMDRFATFAPEKNESFLRACEHYISGLQQEGKLKAAQPIVREGKIISGSQAEWKEGSFNETGEVIVGYYHVMAKDLDEAVAIAKGNPEFEYTPTARVEVRPVKTIEQSTKFVYPDRKETMK